MAIVSSISGLRATLDDLTPELIMRYAYAFHEILGPGKIVIGQDGRQSCDWIILAIRKTYQSLGRETVAIGMKPTPTVQLVVEEIGAAGGISITASHNPAEWNGLKFINSRGIFLNNDENQKLQHFINDAATDSINIYEHMSSRNTINTDIDASAIHINKILSMPFVKNIVHKIKEHRFKVVVDAVNASGSFIVPAFLSQLNCDVIGLYCNGTGNFPHTPEPLPENLTALAAAVKEHNADVGIAVDPDADRLVIIDNNGHPIGEEMTICVAIDSLFKLTNLHNSAIVVNQSTTKSADEIAKKYSSVVHRSAVGEINVVQKMQEVNAVIGGEGSGGVILPECHYGRDSLVGILLLFGLLAHENTPLSDIIAAYPKYEMVKTKQYFDGDFSQIINKLQSNYPADNISLIDGVKLNLIDSWAHIRKSNTEQIIRIIAEAKTKVEANTLIKQIKSALD